MPGKTRWRGLPAVKKAMEAGLIQEQAINDRVKALLKLLERTGKFSDRRDPVEETAQNLPEHQKLIREAGAEGIVLLKNDRNVLPIDKSKCKKIALLGPLAKYAAAHGGGSASLNAHYKISPFDAFSAEFGQETELTYSKGEEISSVASNSS